MPPSPTTKSRWANSSLALSTWIAGTLMLAAILYLNLWPLIAGLCVPDPNADMRYLTGWPADIFDYRSFVATLYPSLSSLFTHISMRKVLLNIIVGATACAIAIVCAELFRRRHGRLPQLSITQCLAITALASSYLAIINQERGGFQAWAAWGAMSLFLILEDAFRLGVYGSLAFCVLFLATPSWWRRNVEPDKV